MKLIREYINEKFVEDSDPIHDMGIGVFVKKDFDSQEKVTDFILKMLPAILKTSKIPEDIIFKEEYHVGAFKWKYYRILCEYCKQYISIMGTPVSFNYMICTPLWKKLLKMGYPKIDQTINPPNESVNEKFTADSDPIQDMGIGQIALIKKWLYKMEIKNYTINDDLSIDVNGKVLLKDGKLEDLKELPPYIQFRNIINGYFSISDNKLESLRGCPRIIDKGRSDFNGDFLCYNNKLTSLKYAPIEVSGYFCARNNAVKFTKGEVIRRCKVGLSIEV